MTLAEMCAHYPARRRCAGHAHVRAAEGCDLRLALLSDCRLLLLLILFIATVQNSGGICYIYKGGRRVVKYVSSPHWRAAAYEIKLNCLLC